jgi:hypothetical protein
VGYDDASVVLLTCGDGSGARRAPVRWMPAGWPYPHPAPANDQHAVAAPARPGRADVDPLLAGPLRRIVVAGTDADLAAVLVRLLRRDRLDVELAYVPSDRRSAAVRLWGLPHGAAAVELAREGVARPAPLVRDDAGGVLVGRGEIRGTAGSVHGEAYCDGVLALRGSARRLVVTPWPDATPIPRPAGTPARAPARPGSTPPDPALPDPALPDPASPDPVPAQPADLLDPAPPAVAVRASFWGALPDGRRRPVPATARTGRGTAVGRAVQVGCLPATVVHDGVVHPRPVTRWAWYRHVADWLLVRR